jgi:hypothetical protein
MLRRLRGVIQLKELLCGPQAGGLCLRPSIGRSNISPPSAQTSPALPPNPAQSAVDPCHKRILRILIDQQGGHIFNLKSAGCSCRVDRLVY